MNFIQKLLKSFLSKVTITETEPYRLIIKFLSAEIRKRGIYEKI